jgi:four helix bundle protein
MWHYVLNHLYKHLITFGLIIVVGFSLLNTLYERLRGRWGLRGMDDLAGLPLAALLFTSYLFVMTPVINSVIRSAEYEADIFGLNAAAQPDGFAQAALDLSEYRKMEPGRKRKMTRELREQFDRASISILANIGEGAGETARADKARLYEIARGSATETATLLDVMRIRSNITSEEYEQSANS